MYGGWNSTYCAQVLVLVLILYWFILLFCMLTSYIGYLFKKSTKSTAWKKRWFVLNEKNGKVIHTTKSCFLFLASKINSLISWFYYQQLGYTKSSDEKLFRGVINLEVVRLDHSLSSCLSRIYTHLWCYDDITYRNVLLKSGPIRIQVLMRRSHHQNRRALRRTKEMYKTPVKDSSSKSAIKYHIRLL